MKRKKLTGFILVGICAAGLSANAHARNYLVGLNAVTGGSCSSFGGGWEDFAYDGKSGIRFCKNVSSSKPSSGVVDINGIYPGNIGCDSKFGAGWQDFAYDGKADLRYCMKIGDVDVSENYVEDVNAAVGGSEVCNNFAGRGWDPIVYNGHSNITFCAKFR